VRSVTNPQATEEAERCTISVEQFCAAYQRVT